MISFFKEWRVVIFIALTLLVIITVFATIVKIETPYIETKKAECYRSAQRFDPPPQWRWSLWNEWFDSWGNGCELLFNGKWHPAYMIQPALK